ncbi:MAG: putative glycosyltransferase [Clostridiaceae bacterium]|jgi:hypothetical protein|nr:putative glycosyltransferase [Clostridiaceae bacterium]
MKKILMAEALDYNQPLHVGNHQYARLFCENGYEVLWLNPIYSNLLYLNNRELYNNREQYHKDKISEINSNLYIYSPKSLFQYGNYPIFKHPIFNKLSIKFTYPNIKKVLEENDFLNVDILWLSFTKYYYLKDIVKYKKMMHRCSDDISGFKSVCDSMLYFEEKIFKEADTVFVTSKDLLQKKSAIRKDLVYLPNGVELANFQREKFVLPNEYKDNNNKKCIFVGAMHNWIDTQLLKYCSDKLDNIDFYLIGPIDTDISNISNTPNIHILGKRNYDDVPNYLHYSDVSIIPFKVNNFTNSITPVKLYEYMSAGLNVVSTSFKEMEYINSPAYIAKNYDEFCSNIEQAIENKYKNREKNIQFARENAWEKRFEEIQKYI